MADLLVLMPSAGNRPADEGEGGAPVDPTARPGPRLVAAPVAAGLAALVVVGARGAGGSRGLLPGSVANQVLVRSSRPVAVVREPSELQTASVRAQGFELVGIPMGEIPARVGELSPQTPVACLCHHGARSQRVANFLAQNGFTQVANIAGGIDAWSMELDTAVPRY